MKAMVLLVTELLEVMIVEKAVAVVVAEVVAATVMLVLLAVVVTEAPIVTAEARAVLEAQWLGQT